MWVANIAGCLNEPLNDVHFVINRKLYCHPRLVFQFSLGHRNFVLVLQIKIDEMIAMNAVYRENAQDCEIRDQNKNIKGGDSIKIVQMVNRRKLVKMSFFRGK